ncbi:MAG: DUF6326 family protein [Candidatus Hodarchaeales archaeon]
MILEDVKISVKIKLSALWVAVMFLYAYADIKAFYKPGFTEEVISGTAAGMEITQAWLLMGAMLMAVPSLMIFLSLSLPAKVNRLANIIVGEVVLTALVVWHAWKWPTQES